ncbi:MAG: DUF2490 domain-containing protein [Cyanobacteria bacterium]|nr:DUF2490 domain-containing protein [Cyanobacteriota bacterium]
MGTSAKGIIYLLWLVLGGAILVLTLLSQSVWADGDDAVENDAQLWLPVTLNVPVSSKLTASLEAQPRVGNNITARSQWVLTPGLRYKIRPNVSLGTGYMWLVSWNLANSRLTPPERNSTWEHRIWQEVLLQHDLGEHQQWTLINRSRLEERFIEHVHDPAYRWRQLLRVNRSLGKNKQWYVFVGDEAFINLNSVRHGPQASYGQNRFLTGVGHYLNNSKSVRAEVGYLQQWLISPGNKPDRLNHAVLVTLTINPQQKQPQIHDQNTP